LRTKSGASTAPAVPEEMQTGLVSPPVVLSIAAGPLD